MSKTLVVSHSPIFFQGLKNIFKDGTFIFSKGSDLIHKINEENKKISIVFVQDEKWSGKNAADEINVALYFDKVKSF